MSIAATWGLSLRFSVSPSRHKSGGVGCTALPQGPLTHPCLPQRPPAVILPHAVGWGVLQSPPLQGPFHQRKASMKTQRKTQSPAKMGPAQPECPSTPCLGAPLFTIAFSSCSASPGEPSTSGLHRLAMSSRPGPQLSLMACLIRPKPKPSHLTLGRANSKRWRFFVSIASAELTSFVSTTNVLQQSMKARSIYGKYCQI
jgi:hypothetical protein